MTIKRTPSVIGPTDPDVARKLQANLKQAAVIANGRPTVANSELILPSTTIRTSPASITLTTSANNQPSDTVTVYPSSGNVYVSTIDQTIQQNIVNQTGVYSIIAGNNITITSTGVGGTGNVTINSLGGGSGSTGNITFSGTTMTGPAGSVDSYSIYIQPSADFTNALQIYPTADNDIHLFEASGNAITLGDYGQSQISVWGPNSPNANITLQSNGNIWEFGENGQVTLPDGTVMGDIEGANTFGFYNPNNTDFLLELGPSNTWSFNGNTGTTTFPTLSIPRGDTTSGSITGQTILFGDNTQEAIISTLNGNATYQNSQRLVINPGKGADGTAGEGGDIYLWAGRGGSGDQANAVSGGSGGDIKIRGGQGGANGGYGGYIRMEAGDGDNSGGYPGYIQITGGTGGNSQPGGYVHIEGGYGNTVGGAANITAGWGANGLGGNVNIVGGSSGLGAGNCGYVNIWAGVTSPNPWSFDETGNLSLPLGGSIFSTSSTPSGAPGNTIILQPAGSGVTTNQKLMIYPTAGDGDHIHMVTGNLYQTELFMGSDNFYVKLANTGNVVINTNDDAGNTAMWTFGTDGNLSLPGNLIINGLTNIFGSNTALIQPNDDLPLAMISSNANGSISSVWLENTSDVGNSNIAAIYVPEQGSGAVRIINGNNATTVNIWDFGADGNLTLPGNTFSVNYANGTQVPLGGGSYGDSNVVSLLSSFGSNTITTTGNISGGNLLASANVLSNGYARFSGTFDESLASTAGLYVGYAGGTPRVMFGTGTTSQTFEIDNDGGNLRFYKPGSTKATLTSAGDFSVSGNITAVNLFGSLANGNSNVSIATANGNVTIAAVGNTTMTITGTGANITGTLNATGNANVGNIGATAGVFTTVTGNLTTAIQSNVTRTGTLDQLVVSNTVYADGYGARTGSDITLSTAGNGNLIISTAGTGITNFSNKAVSNISNLSATGTLSVTGNANVGNIGATNGVFTGNISGNTNGFTIGYLNIPQVAASNTTIALSDAGKHYYSTSAGNFTLTIPNNTSVSFATGTAISIVVQSAGNVLVNAVSGVTLYMAGNSTAANRVVSNYGMATIMKVATDTWMINGTGVA